MFEEENKSVAVTSFQLCFGISSPSEKKNHAES